MAKCQKRYLVLVGFGLLVIIAAGVWMVFGRKTQIYEKTEEVFLVEESCNFNYDSDN